MNTISTYVPFVQLTHNDLEILDNNDYSDNSDIDIEVTKEIEMVEDTSLLKNIIEQKDIEINKLKELLNAEYLLDIDEYEPLISCKDFYNTCKRSFKDILVKNTTNYIILMNSISILKNSNNHTSKVRNTYDSLSVHVLFDAELQRFQQFYDSGYNNKTITIPTFINKNGPHNPKLFNGYWKTLMLTDKNETEYISNNFDTIAGVYLYPYIEKYYKEIILDCISDVNVSTLVNKSNSLSELNYIIQQDFSIKSKNSAIISNIFKASKKMFDIAKVNKCQNKILLPDYQSLKINSYSTYEHEKINKHGKKIYNYDNNTIELILFLIFLGNRGQPYIFTQNLLQKPDVLYYV
jgi:hypothetical protein